MARSKIQGAQRDFSAGEVDVTMKRADENPLMKSGARQMSNWRILNSRVVQNRPGRRALMPSPQVGARMEEIVFPNGTKFWIAFYETPTGGAVTVYTTAGVSVFTGGGLLWHIGTVQSITYELYNYNIYICYGLPGGKGMRPLVLSWDGVVTWTSSFFTEYVTPGGQKRTVFYRISPQNVIMTPGGTTGEFLVSFSAPVLDPVNMPGGGVIRYRFCGRQMILNGVLSPTVGDFTAIEPLPPSQVLGFSVNPAIFFNLGDLVEGTVSSAKGIITKIGTGNVIQVQLISANATSSVTTTPPTQSQQPGGTSMSAATGSIVTTIGFVPTDSVVGPGGSVAMTSGPIIQAPQGVSIWDEEVMNVYRGWPASVFVDQGRLGFCNFNSVPRGIGWSAISNEADFFIDGAPQNAMFELAPKGRVLYVVPGMEGSEFYFGDTEIGYIPITPANPLKPGSVAFNALSQHGVAQVQPRRAEQSIIYIKAGGIEIGAVQVPGAYYRPYIVDHLSEMRAHLFNAPVALAIPSYAGTFEEKYIYVLNGDGTLAVGKYTMKGGLIDAGPDGKPHVGWVPWSGGGPVNWIAALQADVLFSSTYLGSGVLEILDNTQYLDGAMLVNSLPTPFAPPGGKGPLYVFPGPGASVTLIDQGYRMMGTYQVDANGFIVPQNNGGENLVAATLTAGFPWTAVLEPFAPDAAPGQDAHQRMFKRRVARFAAYVSQSTGFLMARLFSGPLTRTSPALGTVMNQRRVTAWNQDDDATLPPPLREEAQRWRPLGRAFDPRMVIIKDTPGPLVVHEVGMEATI